MNRPSSPGLALLILAYLGFVSLGLPDTLVGVAWPSIRDTFALPQGAVALTFIGAGVSYFFSSFFAGRLIHVLGVGVLLAISSALVAVSGLGYSFAPIWLLFAACSLLHGLGSGAIDAGLNYYAAQHFTARHMNWLHACYTLGATLGPLIMTAVIASYGAWRIGYLIVALTLLALAALFMWTRNRWETPPTTKTSAQIPHHARAREALRHPAIHMQAVIFFIYTGLEATAGQWSYTVFTDARQVSAPTAGLWVTLYWGSIFVGRVFFGFVVERVKIDDLLRWSMLTVVAGATLLSWSPTTTSGAVALTIIGFGLASIYPCLMTRTSQRFGPALAAHAIGFQVSAAILGAALLPSGIGFVAQQFGLETVTVAILAMALSLLIFHEIMLRHFPASTHIPHK